MAGKYTEAQKKASLKYQQKTVAMQIRITSEQQSKYKQMAADRGTSLTLLIVSLLDAEYERIYSG